MDCIAVYAARGSLHEHGLVKTGCFSSIYTQTSIIQNLCMEDGAPPAVSMGLQCALCRKLKQTDSKELTDFVVRMLEHDSLSRLYDQIGEFLDALESRRKQRSADPSGAEALRFTESEIKEHVHFCVATREDSVLRAIVKHKLMERLNEAQNVPQLVALSKALQGALPAGGAKRGEG